MLSNKPTKIDEIFTVDLTLCSKCQINGEDFVNFCGLLKIHKLYRIKNVCQEYIMQFALKKYAIEVLV